MPVIGSKRIGRGGNVLKKGQPKLPLKSYVMLLLY